MTKRRAAVFKQFEPEDLPSADAHKNEDGETKIRETPAPINDLLAVKLREAIAHGS